MPTKKNNNQKKYSAKPGIEPELLKYALKISAFWVEFRCVGIVMR